MANRKYTQEHIKFIRDNIQGTSFKDLTAMFNRHFEMNISVGAMISLADRNGLRNGRDTRFNNWLAPAGARYRFPKGHVPWNKGKKGINFGGKETQFKKGHKPHNWVPIGTERVRKDGYVEIKIQDGHLNKNWKFKHVALWEEAHGPVPEGYVVLFGDGNKRNFDLDNLLLVSRAQLARMNQRGLIQDDADLTKTGILIADVYNKIGERKKKIKGGNL